MFGPTETVVLGQKMAGYLCTVVDHLRKVCSLPQPHAIDKKTSAPFRRDRVLWNNSYSSKLFFFLLLAIH